MDVLYTFPPLSKSALQDIAPGVQEVYEALVERCTIPILDTPWAASQPRAEFFDTAYHLNGDGTAKRVVRVSYSLAALFAIIGCAPIVLRTRYMIPLFMLVTGLVLYGVHRFKMVRLEEPRDKR